MPPIVVSCIVFTCVFAGTLAGMTLRAALPDNHLTTDSRDVMKLGMGLIATMAALVLSLLVASAKGSYDTQRNEITQMSANVLLLDRVLAQYGPESKNARDQLRRVFHRYARSGLARRQLPRLTDCGSGTGRRSPL